MKVLVTGASGLLGRRVVEELAGRGYTVIALHNRNPVPVSAENVRKVKLDITNTVALEDLVLKTRPEVVVHCAAYTDVDGCEVNRSLAWRVNVEATRSIARACRVVRAHLVYVSTDYVFDGEKGMYREDDPPNPVNYYGLTKLVGEEVVKSQDILYTIIRTSAVYGVGGGKKSFAEYVAERLSRGEKVKALVDQYVSPTYSADLAKAIAEVVEAKPRGVLHVAGERMSRYEFAVRVAEALGLPADLIVEARMSEMKGWIARRPRDTSLDTSKARSLLKTAFSDTRRSLEAFAEEYRVKRRK